MPIKYKLSSVKFSVKIQRVKIFSNFWWIEEDTSEFLTTQEQSSKAWQAVVRTLLTNPKQKNRKAEGSEYWYWRNFLICIKNLLFIGFYVIFEFVHFDLTFTLWRLVCCLHSLNHCFFKKVPKLYLTFLLWFWKRCAVKRNNLFSFTKPFKST